MDCMRTPQNTVLAATLTVRALKAKTRRDTPNIADSYHYTVRRTGVSEWQCACLELPGLTSIAPSMGR